MRFSEIRLLAGVASSSVKDGRREPVLRDLMETQRIRFSYFKSLLLTGSLLLCVIVYVLFDRSMDIRVTADIHIDEFAAIAGAPSQVLFVP